MYRFRSCQRFVSWIATFAILIAALAPTVTHAVAFASGDLRWIEICSPQGTRVIAYGSETADQDGKQSYYACAYCGTFAGSFGISTDSRPTPLATGTMHERVPTHDSTCRVTLDWPDFMTRAPPVLA